MSQASTSPLEAAGRSRVRAILSRLERTPAGASVLGLGVAAAMMAVYAASGAWLGFTAPFLSPEEPLGLGSFARQALVISTLTGFLAASWRYGSWRAAQDMAAMRELTDCSEREFRAIAQGESRTRRGQLSFQLCAVAIGVGIIPATSQDPWFFLESSAWLRGGLAWSIAANVLLFGLMGRAAYWSRRMAAVPNRITERIQSLDLLDRAKLRPFSRLGLRQAFFWAGGSSIASLLALDLERLGPLFAVLVVTLALSTSAFISPARAIHDRIAAEKRRELERVRDRIRRARDGALAGETQGAASLPGLLAYEARIVDVPEWPFDTGTRLRFAALVVLAVGSWLGGALVERLLGFLLGT